MEQLVHKRKNITCFILPPTPSQISLLYNFEASGSHN